MPTSLQFNTKLFIGIFFAFVASTIVGTLAHEFGHYAVAEYLGYDARINYASAGYRPDTSTENYKYWNKKWEKYPEEIRNKQDFHGSEDFYKIQDDYRRDGFYINLGGPVQTMLTGTFGLLLLFAYKNKFSTTSRLKIWQWVLILLTLFWLRQSANVIVGLGNILISGNPYLYGDEIAIASYFGLPRMTFSVITGILGFIILGLVLFKFIPKKQRLTFLAGGFLGGILGYLFWLEWFGPMILP